MPTRAFRGFFCLAPAILRGLGAVAASIRRSQP